MYTQTSIRPVIEDYPVRPAPARTDYDQDLGKRAGTAVHSQLAKSLQRCLISLSKALPQDDLIIEDLLIKGDRVVVCFRTAKSSAGSQGRLEGDPSVSVMKVEVLSLNSGEIIERWDTVYQVNTYRS